MNIHDAFEETLRLAQTAIIIDKTFMVSDNPKDWDRMSEAVSIVTDFYTNHVAEINLSPIMEEEDHAQNHPD